MTSPEKDKNKEFFIKSFLVLYVMIENQSKGKAD